MDEHIFYASDYAVLDSDVVTGGGTDDTAALQSILDLAKNGRTSVRLIMDGAALVTGLTIYSNTSVVCVNQSCGFFLKDGSNTAIFRNQYYDRWRGGGGRNRNISFEGGTYNHNAKGQIHNHPLPEGMDYPMQHEGSEPTPWWVIAFMFCGVENFTMKDIIIRNQRTFCLAMADWSFVNMENITILLDEYMPAQNQDGLHFFGPGDHLTLRNITGNAGDDIIALAPDEVDGHSSITDVVIDGLHLNHSDQGIRMLCGRQGLLDRVLVKNVTGTFRGFGFIMNPWYDSESGGHFGSITIDTVDIRCDDICYDYMPPFIFKFGGNMDNITLRNIHYHGSVPHYIADIGGLGFAHGAPNELNRCRIRNLTMEDIYVYEDKADHDYIHIWDTIDNLKLKNVQIFNRHNNTGTLIRFAQSAQVDSLVIEDSKTRGIKTLTQGLDADKVKNIHIKQLN